MCVCVSHSRTQTIFLSFRMYVAWKIHSSYEHIHKLGFWLLFFFGLLMCTFRFFFIFLLSTIWFKSCQSRKHSIEFIQVENEQKIDEKQIRWWKTKPTRFVYLNFNINVKNQWIFEEVDAGFMQPLCFHMRARNWKSRYVTIRVATAWVRVHGLPTNEKRR